MQVIITIIVFQSDSEQHAEVCAFCGHAKGKNHIGSKVPGREYCQKYGHYYVVNAQRVCLLPSY